MRQLCLGSKPEVNYCGYDLSELYLPSFSIELNIPLIGERALLDQSTFAVAVRDEKFFPAFSRWKVTQGIIFGTELTSFHPFVELGGGLRWQPVSNASILLELAAGNDGFSFGNSGAWYFKPQIELQLGVFILHTGVRFFADDRLSHYIGVGFDLAKIVDEYYR